MSSTGDFQDFTARLRAFMRAPECGEKDFDSLALELFALQFKFNAPYRGFCEARRVQPETLEHWSRIPAIPTSAFKELELSCLPAGQRDVVFYSSGTTGQSPSCHFHNAASLAVYEASVLAWFNAHFRAQFPLTPALSPGERRDASAADFETRQRLVILTPPPAEAPHSSLVRMFETLRGEVGSADSVFVGRCDADGSWMLDAAVSVEALAEAGAAGRPIFLLGTAFSYVHLLDDLARRDRRFTLPPGSRVMETGGYKGRSRNLPKTELHALITRQLGIPPAQIICEYGMSELSSQAYDWSPSASRFRFPPWCRVQIISPETGLEVAESETGLIRVFDLANVYSVMAVQTEDLGIRYGDGFELIGRTALAEPRGCSLMAV